MYVHRYAIAASPALYILLASGMIALSRIIPIPVSLGIIVLLSAPGLRDYYMLDVHEEWRAMAAYVQNSSEQGEIVVFGPDKHGWLRGNFYWYYDGNLAGCSISSLSQEFEALDTAFNNCISDYEEFWLILRDGETRYYLTEFFFDYTDGNWHVLQEQKFNGLPGYTIYLIDVVD